MNATKYEATYRIAKYAMNATSEVEKIVATLKDIGRAVTCKELGELVYGDAYKRVPMSEDREYFKNMKARELTGQLNQVLRHMVANNYVKVGEIKSEPYTYETEEWISIDDNGEPETIEVWDAKGVKYDMPNPRYNRYSGRGEYRKVTHTGRKNIRTYLWVED